MKDIQQLIKKNSQQGRYEDIFPKTFLDAVIDKESGTTLTDILSSFNMYFLSYTGSRETTRLEVPMSLRKQGLWITYVLYDGNTITEWYGINAVDDVSWQDGNNWRLGSNMLVGDISISADGNWIINGVDTGIPARGEKGDKLLVRVSEDKTKIEYSYNNVLWEELFPLSLITPTIQIAPVTPLEPGFNPTATNIGNPFDVNIKFGLPKSPTINVGSVSTLPAGSKVKVVNAGTQYQVVLDFSIPMGNTGAKGEKGDGWELKGFVDAASNLPSSGNTLGDLYLVGTSTPYQAYVWRGSTYKWVNIGTALEIKASIFDGGRADTKYGGARTIDCGGADAFLT